MEGFAGHQLICRACLKIVENKTQSFGFIEDVHGNLKDMIMCCIPEMDIYVSSNPIMCLPCIQLLVTVYNFKTRCLNTETIIRSYIQRNNLTEYNHVNLSCVIHELIKLNNYFKDAQYKKFEAERQKIEGPKGVPYGMPPGIPGNNFMPPPSHINQGCPPVPMDRGNVPRNHELGRDENITENRFSPGQHAVPEHPGMLQNLLTHPDVTESQPMDGICTNPSESEMCNKEIMENENIQNDRVAPENPFGTHFICDMLENNYRETSNESEEIKQDLKQSKESTEDTHKTATSPENNNNYSSVLKDEEQKDPVAENRPRLIIKICKNKITLPPYRTQDSNEKENKETEVKTNKVEMPPPTASPLDAHHPQENTGHEIHECPGCTFITTHFDYYVAHKKTCFGSELAEKKCPHCPHVTNRQNALNKHINTMHTRSMWYTCDHCHYRSTDPSCLRRHKRNIHPEKIGSMLICRLCKYHCATEYHLQKHMRKHDVHSVLHCEFCSYSTRDRSNFRKHVFIHNPKPHACEFCDYKCVSPYQMKLHLKKLHHGIGMEDIDCRSEVSISKVVQDISNAIKEAKGDVDVGRNKTE